MRSLGPWRSASGHNLRVRLVRQFRRERKLIPLGKVRLQKVFRLFEWTSKNVKQYGHDRVDLMLESYRAMGYISDESAKLVRDITRLMPTTLGEIHEISADEFVSELYELNHILNPTDATLDRDMIEVLMEKRGGPVKIPGSCPGRPLKGRTAGSRFHSFQRQDLMNVE